MKPSSRDVVCSKHFINEDNTELPSLALGYDYPEASILADEIFNLKLIPSTEEAVPHQLLPRNTEESDQVALVQPSTSSERPQISDSSSGDESAVEEYVSTSEKESGEEGYHETVPKHVLTCLDRSDVRKQLKSKRKIELQSDSDQSIVTKKRARTSKDSHDLQEGPPQQSSDDQLPAAEIELESGNNGSTSSSETVVGIPSETDVSDPPVNTPNARELLNLKHTNEKLLAEIEQLRKKSGPSQTDASDQSVNTAYAGELLKMKHINEELLAENERLRKKCELWEEKYSKLRFCYESKKKRKPDPLTFLSNDAKIKSYTGFVNSAVLNGFFDVLEPYAKRMRFWNPHATPVGRIKRPFKNTPKRHGPPRQLPLKTEYIMTLMRVRMGLSVEFLSDLFGVSETYCSQTLITWIKFLASQWKCLIYPPPKEIVRNTLPTAFRSMPRLRYIIDGTEVFCESSGDLKMQAYLWSSYKHHQTAKFLIAINPNGHIAFVSKAFGGRITDKELTKHSGFYDILEQYDHVMADKGFPIVTELNERLCTLVIPKGRRGIDQFAKEDIIKTKKIANTRIHVERAISRIKKFRMLQGDVPLVTLPQLSDVMIICCALSNSSLPLIVKKSKQITP